MRQSTQAISVLFCVTILWGLTFPLIKNAVHDIHPSAFVTLRLALAALVMLPFVFTRLRKLTASLLVAGLILGFLNGMIYITQSIGLETTSSANSAFITALNVIFVPLLSPLFQTGRIKSWDIVAILLALLGIFVLTGGNLSYITRGDFWTLGCALSYALFIVFLQRITQQTVDVLLLVFLQIVLAIPLPLSMAVYTHSHFVLDHTVWIALVFCAVFATCLTFYLQSTFQRYTTATKAALIYIAEPLFATIFAFFLNGEAITYYTLLGGMLILSGFVVSELLPKLKYTRQTTL